MKSTFRGYRPTLPPVARDGSVALFLLGLMAGATLAMLATFAWASF